MAEGSPEEDEGADEAEGRGEGRGANLVSGFQVRGVDHVHITTPEELEKQVIDWYTDCLGLERVEKPEGTWPKGTWFSAGGQEIHVSKDEHNPPKEGHFGLVVDDFPAAIEVLRANGCHIEQASNIPGRHRCYTRDPAGNRIELLAFDDESGGRH
ncbi:MAG: VOC family protein [Actinomycetota bacterium]